MTGITKSPGCPLCDGTGGTAVVHAPKFRVIRAAEPGFPAFYRVIWNDHVAEFSDLPPADRAVCMQAVVDVESVLREHLLPGKVNLAALGNAVPHLHWHVVARFRWDSHFPGSTWSAAQRAPDAAKLAAIEAMLPAVDADIARCVAARPGNCTSL